MLDALRSLDRISGVTPAEVLRRVLQLLRSEKIDATALAQMARLEPPRVRAMVGALIEEVRPEAVSSALLDVLRLSLNPATRYRIPAAAGQLSTAANWGIR